MKNRIAAPVARWFAGVVAALLMVAVVAPVPTEALDSFDRQILAFMNDYRAERGIEPLIESPELSATAQAWTDQIPIGSGLRACDIELPTEPALDPSFGTDTIGVPAGSSEVAEFQAEECFIVGFRIGFSGAGSSLLDECREAHEITSPVGQWCHFIQESGARNVMLDPGYTHVGLGSQQVDFESGPVTTRAQITTFRFAKAFGGCDSITPTIDMNRNGGIGVGSDGDDVILGTPGDDQIDGGSGNDIICAGEGNDVVVGGDGNDVIFGQDGNDVLRGNAGRDTIEGGAGADRVLGGIDDDTLFGGDGNDFIGGFGGNDQIDGGNNADTIFGGFGADTIDGGDGPDQISGLVGDDTIRGGRGDDVLNGDRGNDLIEGGTGNDSIKGGNANDRLFGGGGDDVLGGGKADDFLSGDGGFDSCSGNQHLVGDTAAISCNQQFGFP